MAQENQNSDRQTFVYELIYPAFLGAMLFEMVPLKSNSEYFIGVVLVSYYLFDYCHLYFYLKKRIKQEQRNTIRYVFFDFLVSLLLFFSFKYIEHELDVTIWTLALVPFCFLMYSSQLNYRTRFYWGYFILGIIGALVWALISPENLKLKLALVYAFGMMIIYGVFILTTPKLLAKK